LYGEPFSEETSLVRFELHLNYAFWLCRPDANKSRLRTENVIEIKQIIWKMKYVGGKKIISPYVLNLFTFGRIRDKKVQLNSIIQILSCKVSIHSARKKEILSLNP
jgi:hypothetical protein